MGKDWRPSGVLTIAQLAEVKKLPVDFLIAQGLRDTPDGVSITYRNEDGSPAKRHRVRSHLEHAGPWSWWTGAKGDGEIVPYGLWRLAEARKAGYVILAEGESDAWTLWFHGFSALGVPGSEMTKVLRREYFQGIPVVYISQDGDASGEKFVQDVLKRLKEFHWTGEAFPILPYPHKDFSEFHCADPEKFMEGFGKALETAIEGAKGQPARTETIWDAAAFVSAEEIDEPVEFLEEPVLARGGLTELSGPRGMGKTNYAQWLAVKLAKAGLRVLYLDRDNPPRKARQGLREWGGAGTVKLLTRDKIPSLLGNHADWKKFPIQDYDAVIVDSWDSAAEVPVSVIPACLA
jgi:hypothetical protein